ncbi:hypothetical protein Vadar_003415 [Vaccinium darrowii]|uniref:Uncharacterized protein n=1 Tax=Vaccinium darrowii TaxID=229202 RepID=A0ACB7XMU9_9ERIC|nr:hypothetical protein Vadar_003415 [Vaccinium darrowii]
MAKSCKDLPDECWEQIFIQLLKIHRSHLQSPSLSCKRFLSITNAIRTRLRIYPTTALPISTLLNRFPNIDSIHLRWFTSLDDLHRVVTDIATSDLDLETLDFTGIHGLLLESWRILGTRFKNLTVLICSRLGTLRDSELVVIADSMPGLEHLDICYPTTDYDPDEFQARSPSEVGVTDSGIEVLSSKLKALQKINISGNEFLTDKSLIALSTNCIYLTEINALTCPLVTEYGIEFVMRNSSNMSSLLFDDIDLGQFDDYSICSARNISSLVIYDSVVPDEYLHLLVKAEIPLNGISFSRCKPSSFTFAGISSLLNKYRSLEWLSLTGIDFLTDEKMSGLSQCLSALVLIRLCYCCNLTESTFFMLAKNCPLLEEIRMERTNLEGGRDRATDAVKNTRIKSLSLGGNLNLSDECLAKLASVCPSVEVLDVSSCNGITEKGIAEFWKSGSKIRELRIDYCLGIRNIGNSFELSELETLRAARSGINDDGLVVIGNRCGRLLKLSLEACSEVTTVGLEEIVRNCKRLRKIDLTGCSDISSGFVELIVISRPSLRKIILPHSSLPSKSQRKLFLRYGCLVLSK